MGSLFEQLTHLVEGGAVVAGAAAFVWGVLSILLSPCHLSSIPLLVGFLSEQGSAVTPRRAASLSALFAVGILTTIAIIGVITALLGRMMGDIGAVGNYFVAVIFFLIGLHLVGVIPLSWAGPGMVNMKRRGALAALLLGFIFGIALGPCTFAYMAPMLAVTFKVAATDFIYGAILLLLYGLGHCSIIIVAGGSASLVQRYLNWTEASNGARYLRVICGVLVILGGWYLLYTAPIG